MEECWLMLVGEQVLMEIRRKEKWKGRFGSCCVVGEVVYRMCIGGRGGAVR